MLVDILGEVTVTVGGQRCQIGSNKVRALLATLALDVGRTVSSDQLVDELWAGHPLRNTRNALQAHVTRLRKVVDQSDVPGATRLLAMHHGYLLDIPPENVDANRFLDLAARGSAEVRRDPQRGLDLLESALSLWRGPALLGAGDGVRARAAAALFEEQRLTVWEDVVTARLSMHDERQAIADLTPLVAHYPSRERFCEQLMLALYRCGRQSEALEVFRRTWQRLNREVGVEPGQPLKRRYAAILAHDPVLTSRGAVWVGSGA